MVETWGCMYFAIRNQHCLHETNIPPIKVTEPLKINANTWFIQINALLIYNKHFLMEWVELPMHIHLLSRRTSMCKFLTNFLSNDKTTVAYQSTFPDNVLVFVWELFSSSTTDSSGSKMWSSASSLVMFLWAQTENFGTQSCKNKIYWYLYLYCSVVVQPITSTVSLGVQEVIIV